VCSRNLSCKISWFGKPEAVLYVQCSISHHRTLVPEVNNLTYSSMQISELHLRIFYASLARRSNYELLDCHFLHMLCSCAGGHCNTNDTRSTPHRCQLVWAQWARGIKASTYTNIYICFPPKISNVIIIVVAFKCGEKSLGKFLDFIFKTTIINLHI